MIKREYFDTETNMVSTISMTATELLVEIENRLGSYETLSSKEILLHALTLASIFPKDCKSHFNNPHYFISLTEYTDHDIDLIISLVSEKYGIRYNDLKEIYDYIISRYTIQYYDGGVRKTEFQLPTYVRVICDISKGLQVKEIINNKAKNRAK